MCFKLRQTLWIMIAFLLSVDFVRFDHIIEKTRNIVLFIRLSWVGFHYFTCVLGLTILLKGASITVHVTTVHKISHQCDMGQNQVILRHQKFTFPRARKWAKWASKRMSELSGGHERSEQSRASERVSGASERANGRASGPVLTSLFLFVPDHSGLPRERGSQQESLMVANTMAKAGEHHIRALWSRTGKKANKWGKQSAQAGRSKGMSEQCEQPSEWTSEWSSTYIRILGYSGPWCRGGCSS